MGFFQDLKEDLSQAVGELLPEEEMTGQQEADIDVEEDAGVDAALKEVEAALAAEFDEKTDAPVGAVQTEVEEAVSEAVLGQQAEEEAEEAVEQPQAESDKETEAKQQAEAVSDEAISDEAVSTHETEPMKEEPKKEESQPAGKSASQPVVEAAAAQIASIAGMVAKDETAEPALSIAEYEEREEQPVEELLDAIQNVEEEESDIEKEVGKVVEKQKMNLADEAVADETAIITAGMEITGDIVSKGSMDIQGSINGNLEILGKLNISGKITGDSKAAEVFADSAKITGKIVAEGTVKIGENSVVIGNIEATSAVIAGAVKGDLDVHGPVILDTSAIVMGNIKSKSVQINNGAVIEGMCSQCYAEVNPTSFFDGLIAK